MEIQTALLEEWLRQYYFDAEIDISSSGVQNFSIADLRRLVHLDLGELDDLVFDDGHSFGSLPLRRLIARRWSNGDPDRVMVTHGSSEAIYLVMQALLEPGHEVVVVDPVYQQLAAVAESLRCRIVRWPLRAERGYVPDFAEARALVSARTRMVVVNFPHNPTGVSITEAQQEELLRIVREAGAYLAWDGAFTDLVHDGRPLPDPTVKYERCVAFGTLSKAYGLAGLRVGWCMAPPALLQQCVQRRDYVTLHLSPMVERIAIRALEHADRLLASRLTAARENLDVLAEWVHAHEPFVRWVAPRGGVCTLLTLPLIPDATAFCHTLARQHGVLVVPGSCFGRPDGIRVGFGGAAHAFREGLTRLSRCVQEVVRGHRHSIALS